MRLERNPCIFDEKDSVNGESLSGKYSHCPRRRVLFFSLIGRLPNLMVFLLNIKVSESNKNGNYLTFYLFYS
jgi:hypothetical protein